MGRFTTSLFNLVDIDPSGGGGSAAFSFGIIQTDTGTYPTADAPSDTLSFTTANTSDYFFDGNATTDTVTLNLVNFYNKPETENVAIRYAIIFG